MRTIYASLTLGCALLLTGSVALTAEEKKGANQASPKATAKVKPSAEATAVYQIYLAHSLIEYGRKNDAPEALITAARILAKNGTVELKDKPTHEMKPDAPKGKPKPKKAADNSPRALLEEAKKLSKNNAAIVSLANSIELPRGAVGGPKRSVTTVRGLTTDVFKIKYESGAIARVAISGDGDTRLDLYVYDENGNLIASRVGPGDDALASWVPKWTGTFIIRVVNRGLLSNRYVIATN